MTAFTERQTTSGGAFAVLVASLLLLSACATGPESPAGSMEVRNKLTELRNDPELANHARVEIREAEQAVELAEKPLPESEEALASHRVYMADRMVEIARARATTRLAEDQRAMLGEQRSDARLQARTREADKAHAAAAIARSSAAEARSSAADMQKRLEELQAQKTERGMVVTLGDVLFDTGSAELRDSASNNLDKLVDFLNQYPDHRLLIEGHTDNVGSAEYNQKLSLRRAESVKQYLTREGIASERLSVSGMGMKRSIASNDTAAGRQQNRRVEIVIKPPPERR